MIFWLLIINHEIFKIYLKQISFTTDTTRLTSLWIAPSFWIAHFYNTLRLIIILRDPYGLRLSNSHRNTCSTWVTINKQLTIGNTITIRISKYWSNYGITITTWIQLKCPYWNELNPSLSWRLATNWETMLLWQLFLFLLLDRKRIYFYWNIINYWSIRFYFYCKLFRSKLSKFGYCL